MSDTCPLCGAAAKTGGDPGAGTFCTDCSRTAYLLLHFLETMECPAALIGRDLTILLANDFLREMVDGPGESGHALRIGEAVGCRYARPPAACGEGSACWHCGLKRQIELSRITGEKLAGIPLAFRQTSGDDRSFRLSTEKAGEAILLKADRINLDVPDLS